MMNERTNDESAVTNEWTNNQPTTNGLCLWLFWWWVVVIRVVVVVVVVVVVRCCCVCCVCCCGLALWRCVVVPCAGIFLSVGVPDRPTNGSILSVHVLFISQSLTRYCPSWQTCGQRVFVIPSSICVIPLLYCITPRVHPTLACRPVAVRVFR